MEGSIKHTDLRQSRHQLLHGIHALQVCRIMQRSKVRAFLEGLQHLIGKNDRLVELLTTMHHAMTYGIDFVETLDNTDFGISEQRENELHALSMLRNVMHNLLFLAIGQLYLYKSTIEAYTLGATTGHHTLVVHVIQSVFNRR